MFGILCVCFGLIPLINAVPEFKDGDLRLLGGSTKNEGTVLIYHNGRWGSICDRGWDIRDGNVACHQLGFQRALQSLRYSPFGPGRSKYMSPYNTLVCYWVVFKIFVYAIFFLKITIYVISNRKRRPNIADSVLEYFCWLKMISMLMSFSFHSMAVEHFEENRKFKKKWYLNRRENGKHSWLTLFSSYEYS